MGQSIQPQQKSWSLLPPRPRNAIPESIASHSSLFPYLSFSLSLSLSLWPISRDSNSCRKRPKSRRRGSQLLKRFQILNTRVDRRTFSSQHVALYTKNIIPLLKLIFVLLICYQKCHNSSTYITRSSMLHPISVPSYCSEVLAGHLTLARPCEEFHWSASIIVSDLLLQKCPACLV